MSLQNHYRPDLNSTTERPGPIHPPNFLKKIIIKICADGTSLKRESGKFQVKYIQEQKSLQYE